MDFLSAEHLAVQSDSGIVLIIAQAKLHTLEGSWKLYQWSRSGKEFDAGKSFDYIARVLDTSYLIHHDDIKLLENMLSGHRHSLTTALRLTGASGDGYYLLFEGMVKSNAAETLPSRRQHPGLSSFPVADERSVFHGELDWKRLETELQQNKLLLDSAIQSDVIAISVLKPIFDENERIIDFEWAMANKLQRAIAQGRNIIGERFSQVFPQMSANGALALMERVYMSGQRYTQEVYHQDSNIKAWMRQVYLKSREFLIISSEDITTTKKVEQQVKNSQEQLLKMNELLTERAESQYRELFSLIDQGFAVMRKVGDAKTLDFIFIQANPAFERLVGVTALGGKSLALQVPNVPDEWFTVLNEVIIQRKSQRLTVPTQGGTKFYDMFIFPSGAQSSQRVAVLVSDITERKLSEQRLQELNHKLKEINREKTAFFSNVSHELKTPLTLMLGPLRDLIDSTKQVLSPTDGGKLQLIVRNAMRLQKMVSTILDFSRFESGKVETFFQPTDIVHHTVNLTASFRSIIEQAGLKFVVKSEPIHEAVYVNRDMWDKIVSNLISNAFKFTHEGKIEVIIKSKHNKFQLLVKDTGIGISAQNLSRIFDRFVRVENVKARTYEGSGIGLALVKELVEVHHGKITVKSAPGKGSTFSISIPTGKNHLASDHIYQAEQSLSTYTAAQAYVEEAKGWRPEQATRIKAATSSKSNQTSKPSIMVVDDNSDMREYLTSILNVQYHVVPVENGLKAIGILLKGFHPELILADVMMPELNGYDLTDAIKKNPALRNIPIVLLTARAEDDSKINAMDAGADDYLVKPFSSRELLSIVAARFRIAEARKQTEQLLLDRNKELDAIVRERTTDLVEQHKLVKDQNSELRELNELLFRTNIELQAADNELFNYTHITSHDLREPLRKIKLYFSQMMDSLAATPQKAMGYVPLINKSIERLNALLNDVNAFAGLHKSDINTFQRVDVAEQVRRAWHTLGAEVDASHATIRFGNLGQIEGNAGQIQLLFEQLLSNAIKFRRPGIPPEVLITCRKVASIEVGDGFEIVHDEFAELRFSDNGIGYDTKHGMKVFDMFQQLHPRGDFAGTGMGLAYCRKIMENHKGLIKIFSEPGKGTVASCYFPIR